MALFGYKVIQIDGTIKKCSINVPSKFGMVENKNPQVLDLYGFAFEGARTDSKEASINECHRQ